ncbi:hypothetical protein RB601_007029 [Gaeumannomyces tritici]
MRMHLKFLNAIPRRPSRRSALLTRSPSSQPARNYNRFRALACLAQHVAPCAISEKNNLDECFTLSNHLAMLSRAIRDPNPKGSSESRTPRHALTAKQTPPSRPDAASSSRPSIAEQLKGTAARAAASTAESALSRRSINLPGRPGQIPAALSGSRRTIASICHNTSSFDDEPAVFGLFDDEATAKKEQAKRVATSVYIADDDLSDDDALDLDFEAPSALPSIPATKPNDVISAPVASGTSVLSWSQSSDSHHLPPPREHESGLRPVSTKREATVIDLEAVPLAKRRAIPQHWEQPFEPIKEDARSATGGHDLGHPSRGSSGRKDKQLPWDAPANLVKTQKKQLRDQQRKPAAADQETMVDDIQETVDEHVRATTSKNSSISLSNEQRHVKGLVCERNLSVFFTGPAGTGKSVLMRAIISDLKKKWAKDPDRLAVTASTGLAACNIGGMTLHSFSGIGLGKEDAQTLVKKIRRNPKAKNRWLRTKILIIDEISMVDGDLFDKLSQIGRTIRNNGRPWGGIQLVITGDFFQLPPVPDSADKRDIKFAFEAATWNTSIDHTIGLTEVFRQKDPEFASMLNEMRLGRISDQTVKNFKALCRPLHFKDGLEVTELFPTRSEVDGSNNRRLKSLQSKQHRFDAIDTGDQLFREKLLQNMMAPKTLELRKGAQVMLIKNMDDTLVNGSLGTVSGFMTEATFQAINPGGDYDSGAEDEDDKDAEARKKRLMAFSRQLEESGSQDNKEYPLVRFHAVDGSPRVLLCVPEEWKSELPTGEVQASRKQVPLILAWALSIHKAQGQTLERVKVDLGKVFEKGQAYVALSRATSQSGLQVLRFEKHKVMAHPRVVDFYNKLYSAESAVAGGRAAAAKAARTGMHGGGSSMRAMSATG